MASAVAACCLLALALAAPTRSPTPTGVPTRAPTATVARTATPTPAPPARATPLPTATPIPTPAPSLARATLVGRSLEQRDIIAYTLGGGPIGVAIVGGMHGAPEANSAWLVWELLRYFEHRPESIPRDMTLQFLPEANPDGLADGTRELADGVDPNRNWPTADWSPSSFGPYGALPGGGGAAPMSEPETVTLANWILDTQPRAVLSFHSAGGLVMGGPAALSQGLVDAYLAGARGYVYREWIYYPVTGDFAQWCEDLSIPTVEVELWDHFDPDTDRNLAGVQAVLFVIELAARGNPSY